MCSVCTHYIIITINDNTTALFSFFCVSKYEKIHQSHPRRLLRNNRDRSGIRVLIKTFVGIILIYIYIIFEWLSNH